MKITRKRTYVTVMLPVEHSEMWEDGTRTIYNLTVAGLVSLFEALPESVKREITEKLASGQVEDEVAL